MTREESSVDIAQGGISEKPWQSLVEAVYLEVPEFHYRSFIGQSNGIEGIWATAGLPHFEQHKVALDCALAHSGPLTHEVILDWHEKLLGSPSINEVFAGRYRDVNVRVGLYVPPFHEVVSGYMHDMMEELNHNDHLTREECWYYHAWLESIHPFQDGNGRLGRIFLAYLYKINGYGLPIVREQTKALYYELLELWRIQEV